MVFSGFTLVWRFLLSKVTCGLGKMGGKKKKQDKLSASFSTALFAILAMISTVSLCMLGLLVALGMGGARKVLRHYIPFASVPIGCFLNSCVLNIALYWVLLGTSKLVRTRINVSEKGFGILAATSCFYLAAVCGIYVYTGNVLMTLSVSLAADIMLAIAMSIGCFKLSRKLAKGGMTRVLPRSGRMRRHLGRSSEGGMRFSVSVRSSFNSEKVNHQLNTGRSNPLNTGRRGIQLDRAFSSTTSGGLSNSGRLHDGNRISFQKKIVQYSWRIASRLYLSFFCTIGFAFTAMNPRCTTSATMGCSLAFLDLWSVLSCCQIVLCCMDEKNIYKRTVAKHISKDTARNMLHASRAKVSPLLRSFCTRRKQRPSQIYVAAEDLPPSAQPHFLSSESSSSSAVERSSSSLIGREEEGGGGLPRRVAPAIAQAEGRGRSTQEVVPSANSPRPATTGPSIPPGAAGFTLGHSALIYDVVFFFSC
mmetsp:Transcript_21616/g.34624  ORF Transcript_21616/g.34624 Transcript_21616/m.34624 type:complete len:477 (+) Transcript_21616:244-1674(+)